MFRRCFLVVATVAATAAVALTTQSASAAIMASFDQSVQAGECEGIRDFDRNSFYRSGTVVQYEGRLYQSRLWTKGKLPTDTQHWTFLMGC